MSNDDESWRFDNSPWASKKSNLKKGGRAIADSRVPRGQADKGIPEKDVYYRKMSQAEYEDTTKTKRINMKAALKYVDTKYYRYWLSTSQVKVEQFQNEKAADDGNIVVKFTFRRGFSDEIRPLLRPHQMRGVQHDGNVVAYHREGFLQRGNVQTTEEMNQLLIQQKHHNVGFTQNWAEFLQRYNPNIWIVSSRSTLT